MYWRITFCFATFAKAWEVTVILASAIWYPSTINLVPSAAAKATSLQNEAHHVHICSHHASFHLAKINKTVNFNFIPAWNNYQPKSISYNKLHPIKLIFSSWKQNFSFLEQKRQRHQKAGLCWPFFLVCFVCHRVDRIPPPLAVYKKK